MHAPAAKTGRLPGRSKRGGAPGSGSGPAVSRALYSALGLVSALCIFAYACAIASSSSSGSSSSGTSMIIPSSGGADDGGEPLPQKAVAADFAAVMDTTATTTAPALNLFSQRIEKIPMQAIVDACNEAGQQVLTIVGREELRERREQTREHFESEARMLQARTQHHNPTVDEFKGKLCLQKEREAFVEALGRLRSSRYRSALRDGNFECRPPIDFLKGERKWTIVSAALPPNDALQILAIKMLLSFAGAEFVFLGQNPSDKAMAKAAEKNQLIRMNALDPKVQTYLASETPDRKILLFTTSEGSWDSLADSADAATADLQPEDAADKAKSRPKARARTSRYSEKLYDIAPDSSINHYSDLAPYVCEGGCCAIHPADFASHAALHVTLRRTAAVLGLEGALSQEHIDETIRIVRAAACMDVPGEKPKRGSRGPRR